MDQSRELPYPHTDMIVSALLVLGVEGPAVAVDVLNAAGTDLPPEQVEEVLSKITASRPDRSTGSEDPGK